MSYKIFITGIVQGIGFRPTVYRIAKEMALKGYVRNNGSNVEICIDRNHKEFLAALKSQLPKIARIESVRIEKCNLRCDKFKILDSKDGARISLIPADTAVCKECVAEIFGKKNRRYLYPFTNCVVCGARFSVIKTVPYDRKNTSMEKFALCDECYKEYTTPENRRFHAQTISCPKCGPVYSLYDRNKKALSSGVEAIEECARLIDKNKICVLKGWGGMHLCCSLETIEKFRKWYSREEKPFAIMLRDIETVKRYAQVNDYETELLTSLQRPIVLLKKIESRKKEISPGLPNIGIMLPYSGLHHILFKYMKSDGIVMTSANISGEPMIIKNDAVFALGAEYSRAKRVSIRGLFGCEATEYTRSCKKQLRSIAEGNSEVYYLLHNRDIVNRCDDSVLRIYKNKIFFIRRSRGYVPEKININHKKDILSLGAEENVSTGIAKNGMLYLSQYIGDATHYDTLEFARSSINTLISFLNIKQVDGVAVDLHPRYTTRALGMSIAEEHNSDIVEVQHHWAHAASLMIDNNIHEGEIICLCLDGTGYGSDRKVWGGEILNSGYSRFERLASLEEIPLIGSDAAIKDPRRIVFGIAEKLGKGSEKLCTNLKLTKIEEQIFRKAVNTAPATTSFGRVLDALSCALGICMKQTYDGEPAMKLEKYLLLGEGILCNRKVFGRDLNVESCVAEYKERYEFDVETSSTNGRKVLKTVSLFEQLSGNLRHDISDRKKAVLAYSFVHALTKAFAEIGVDCAERKEIECVGITGGVSYNEVITRIAENTVKRSGKKFLIHNNIPNGDNGIAVGQNAIAGNVGEG